MKIFRIIPAPFHIRQFRELHELKNKSFKEQIKAYRDENIALPGGWAAAMEVEGFEVFESVYSDAGSQSRWAIEHGWGHLIAEPDYILKILKKQVEQFDPDIIFIYAGAFFMISSRIIQQLRACCSKHIIVTGLWGDELPHNTSYAKHFAGVDLMFCSSSAYEKKFCAANIPAMTIGNCFDNTVQFKLGDKKDRPVIFMGATGYGFPDHVGRYEKMIELMRKVSQLRIWTSEPNLWPTHIRDAVRWIYYMVIRIFSFFPMFPLRVIRKLSPLYRIKRIMDLAMLSQESGVDIAILLKPADTPHNQLGYFNWKRRPLRSLFRRRVSPLVPNCSDYYSITAGTKIIINLHRDEDADIGNIRCYEATGLGSCLLTDRGRELGEFFQAGEDFVAFDTIDECAEKIKFLLSNPKELERISRHGQQTTLSNYTVKHRCHAIAEKLREMIAMPATAPRRRLIVEATYNLNQHPISYDIAYFLQAAEIYRKQCAADLLHINIVWPEDIRDVNGVSKEADAAVDADGRVFRIHHICGQFAQLMKAERFTHIYNAFRYSPSDHPDILPFPPRADHHSVYYRSVMENPALMTGFSASPEAQRYIKKWLDSFVAKRKVLTVTLRQYRFNPQRNSNIEAWAKFLERVDQTQYAIVIVPDTDSIEEFRKSILGVYNCFDPTCFDVDLRLALYELAFLNLFINNGPCFAASLDKEVNFLLFKILTPSVPHCTQEFLEMNGFKIGENLPYATPYQKLVWEDDDAEVIWREFCSMKDKINAARALPNDLPLLAKSA